MRVDFPDPEAPTMAMKSPRSTVRLMPRSARTSLSPTMKVRVTFSSLSRGSDIGVWLRFLKPRQGGLRRCAGLALAGDHQIAGIDRAFFDLGKIIVVESED